MGALGRCLWRGLHQCAMWALDSLLAIMWKASPSDHPNVECVETGEVNLNLKLSWLDDKLDYLVCLREVGQRYWNKASNAVPALIVAP